MPKYQRPDWFTKHLANPLVAFFTRRLGISMRGSRVLSVRGRKSGQWRRTPVNPLEFDGQRYLVAPRGETEWVKNIRAAGGGMLLLGRKIEPIRVQELPDAEKPPVLRAYVKHWKAETAKFFDLSSVDAGDEEFLRIAPDHPVFRILPQSRSR